MPRDETPSGRLGQVALTVAALLAAVIAASPAGLLVAFVLMH